MKPKKKMSMYMGGGENKPMNMYKGKVYEEGGLLAALMKDPKQRAKAKKMLGSMEKGGMMYAKNGTKVKNAAERLASYKEQLKKGGLTSGQREQLERSIKSLERQGVGLPKGTKLLPEVTVSAKRPYKGNARITEEGQKYRNSNQAKQDYINAAAKDMGTSSRGLTMADARKQLDMPFNEWQGKHMEEKGMKIRIDPKTGQDLK